MCFLRIGTGKLNLKPELSKSELKQLGILTMTHQALKFSPNSGFNTF